MRWNKELQHTRVTRPNLTPDCGSRLVPVLFHDWIFEPKASGINLVAVSLVSDSTIDTATISQVHGLSSTGIVADSTIGTGALGQIHSLSATGIATNPVLGIATVGQIHGLSSIGIVTNPTTGNPEASIAPVVIALTAVGLDVGTSVDVPGIAQVHGLSADSICSGVVVDVPVFHQIYGFTADGLIVKTIVGNPRKISTTGMISLNIESKSYSLEMIEKAEKISMTTREPSFAITGSTAIIETK